MTHLSEDTIAAIDSLKRQFDEHEELLASHERLRVALVTIREVSQPEDYSEYDVRHWLATCQILAREALAQIPKGE